jgi:Ca2+-binding EF-hand superfamily protein
VGSGASTEEFNFPMPASYAGLTTEQQENMHSIYAGKIANGKSPVEAIAELDAEFDEIEGIRLAKKVKDQFDSIDADGDGKITRSELATAIPDASKDDITEAIRAADVNGDGEIGLGEFQATLEKEEEVEEIKQEFECIDGNHDGSITVGELKAFVEATGADIDVIEGMEQMDADKDGKIELEEFTKAMAVES